MATQILATGSGAADSANITVVDGSSIVVALKGQSFDADVAIKLQDDAGGWNVIGNINGSNPSRVVAGAGVYRFSRVAGTCGVFHG